MPKPNAPSRGICEGVTSEPQGERQIRQSHAEVLSESGSSCPIEPESNDEPFEHCV